MFLSSFQFNWHHQSMVDFTGRSPQRFLDFLGGTSSIYHYSFSHKRVYSPLPCSQYGYLKWHHPNMVQSICAKLWSMSSWGQEVRLAPWNFWKLWLVAPPARAIWTEECLLFVFFVIIEKHVWNTSVLNLTSSLPFVSRSSSWQGFSCHLIVGQCKGNWNNLGSHTRKLLGPHVAVGVGPNLNLWSWVQIGEWEH